MSPLPTVGRVAKVIDRLLEASAVCFAVVWTWVSAIAGLRRLDGDLHPCLQGIDAAARPCGTGRRVEGAHFREIAEAGARRDVASVVIRVAAAHDGAGRAGAGGGFVVVGVMQ